MERIEMSTKTTLSYHYRILFCEGGRVYGRGAWPHPVAALLSVNSK